MNQPATLRKVLRSAGFEIRRIAPPQIPVHPRMTMMRHHRIEMVIDVGASVGQYASMLTDSGYAGEIMSFEPLSWAFCELQKKAHSDVQWKVFNMAIGSENGEADLHVAANSVSSSFLPMLETHLRNAPESRYVSTERVQVRTLDSLVLPDLLKSGKRTLLKIDTQGHEHKVLSGAAATLDLVDLIECELSLVPLYEGQYLFQDMIDLFRSRGFVPVYFEPGFGDTETGYCLQLESIFARAI